MIDTLSLILCPPTETEQRNTIAALDSLAESGMKANNIVEKISKENRCTILHIILNSSTEQSHDVYDLLIYLKILFTYIIFIGVLSSCMSVYMYMPGVD